MCKFRKSLIISVLCGERGGNFAFGLFFPALPRVSLQRKKQSLAGDGFIEKTTLRKQTFSGRFSQILLLRSFCFFLCGERGIRTPGTVARTPHFECGPIDHSGISPIFSGLPPFGGGRGIRTPGGSHLNGFQDRRNRPLCHPSGDKSSTFSVPPKFF